MTQLRIGMSGWRYPPWRASFYPKGLAQRLELEYASQQVNSIELNGSFYALQLPTSYQRWRAETPDDFVFSIKAPRFITHMKRLMDVETPLANFFASGPLALGPKLGPVLWQLPATLRFDASTLEAFARLLPRTTTEAAALATHHDERLEGRSVTTAEMDTPLRHALEPRHPSFGSPQALEILREHGIALVVADAAGKWPTFWETTSDFMYVRLHGADELYVSGYTEDGLAEWAGRIRTWMAAGLDVHVYFDNDVKVHAPFDAIALTKRLADLLPG
jgi:uncharacterized protein YecE (DUF72 family)